MVSILAHLLIGSSIYFITRLRKKMNPPNYLFCMLFSILPDFDFIVYYLFPIGNNELYHRIFFHNIFTFALFAFFIYLINKKLKEKYFLTLDFILFYFLHIALDLFDNGVPFLYPLSNQFFLIYQIGDYTNFPLKMIYEGNIRFSILTIILYIISLSLFLSYKKCKKKN